MFSIIKKVLITITNSFYLLIVELNIKFRNIKSTVKLINGTSYIFRN